MTRIYKQYQKRIAFLSVLVIFAWAALGFRLFNIQVANGEKYHNKGIRQGVAKEILPALRGTIYDTNGAPLTRNITHFTIVTNPLQIQDKTALSKNLSKITGKSYKKYLKKLKNKNNFVYLERNLEKQDADPIIEKHIKGVSIQRNSRRIYPQDNIGGQLIGFTNVDGTGLSGIEQIYDKNLSGTDGWIEKQRSGLGNVNLKNSYPKNEPIDGADVMLTLNIEYQSVLQEELQKQLKISDAISATGVIINPQTGAILAIASVPDFNPNKPNKSPTENQKVRALTDQFEPGSTFKFVTATAAIDNNIVKISDEFDCENGSFKYKNVIIGDHKPHKILTFGEIIEHSSNIGIIKVALVVGDKKVYNLAQKYGFGTPTNIGLSGESGGTLRKLDDWSKISLGEIAMGHEVGITALQLALAYAAVANEGILLKPYIIKHIKSKNGSSTYNEGPKVIRKVADKKVMNQLNDLLVKVVESGTGVNANISGWQVAGKTGTAQKFIDGGYSHTKYVSNFVGYLPANNPQLLCVIILDEPKLGYHWGGTGAAPVFKRVMERIIGLDDSIKIPKLDKQESLTPKSILVDHKILNSQNLFKNKPISLSSIAIEPEAQEIPIVENVNQSEIKVPNLKGMSLKKALITLQKNGFESNFVGSGKVVWQSPKSGTISKIGTICSIGLE